MKTTARVVALVLICYAAVSSGERVLLLVVEGLTQQLISRVATPAIDALMRHSQDICPGFFYFQNYHLFSSNENPNVNLQFCFTFTDKED
jgi:hypothetical protein